MIKLFKEYNNSYDFNSKEVDYSELSKLIKGKREFFNDRDIKCITNIASKKGIELSIGNTIPRNYLPKSFDKIALFYIHSLDGHKNWILKLEDDWYIYVDNVINKYYKLDQLDDLLKFIEYYHD